MHDANQQKPNDTFEYITPHALNINKALIGLALAAPRKRLLAILIDLALIALLTNFAAGWIIFVAVIVYLRYVQKSGHSISLIPHASRALVVKTLKPIALLAIALFLLSVIAAAGAWLMYADKLKLASHQVVFHGVDMTEEVGSQQALGVNAFLTTAEKTSAFSDCKSLSCWQAEYFFLAASLPDMNISKPTAQKVFQVFAGFTDLSRADQAQLVNYLTAQYGASMEQHPNAVVDQHVQVPTANYSLVDWLVTLMKDLGLGVSWMAIYFTLFTSVANGQTPGKRLVRIKVIKLDASAITFWDSFFRYGGYAAGITTGLLGYLQIYWDANRQAIQDKISATVVVDLNKQSLNETEVRQLCGE